MDSSIQTHNILNNDLEKSIEHPKNDLQKILEQLNKTNEATKGFLDHFQKILNKKLQYSQNKEDSYIQQEDSEYYHDDNSQNQNSIEDHEQIYSEDDNQESMYNDDDEYQENESQNVDDSDYQESVQEECLEVEQIGGITKECDVVKDDQQKTCGICLQEMIQGDIISLSCNHILHVQCLRPWLDQSRKCPTCKTEIISKYKQ